MKPERPLPINYTFFSDGQPAIRLNRENFLLIERDGTVNALYRDADDETRLYATWSIEGDRTFMIANRTDQGVPLDVVMALKDMVAPEECSMIMGMQRDPENVIGAIMVTLPGGYWKDGKLPRTARN